MSLELCSIIDEHCKSMGLLVSTINVICRIFLSNNSVITFDRSYDESLLLNLK